MTSSRTPSDLVLPDQRIVAVDDLSVTFRRRSGTLLDLARASQATMRTVRTVRTVRGADIAMIFQEPMTSLNPVFTVGAGSGGSSADRTRRRQALCKGL